eukprot:scaffold5772_cov101-Cylindrotheca_fusiformis.AAC.4
MFSASSMFDFSIKIRNGTTFVLASCSVAAVGQEHYLDGCWNNPIAEFAFSAVCKSTEIGIKTLVSIVL